MSSKQIWITMFLTFILLMSTLVGGILSGIVEDLTSIPTTTSEIDIKGNFNINNQTDYPPSVNMTITNIKINTDTRLIDLLILALGVTQ